MEKSGFLAFLKKKKKGIWSPSRSHTNTTIFSLYVVWALSHVTVAAKLSSFLLQAWPMESSQIVFSELRAQPPTLGVWGCGLGHWYWYLGHRGEWATQYRQSCEGQDLCEAISDLFFLSFFETASAWPWTHRNFPASVWDDRHVPPLWARGPLRNAWNLRGRRKGLILSPCAVTMNHLRTFCRLHCDRGQDIRAQSRRAHLHCLHLPAPQSLLLLP